jgi:inosine-uridine nucleoside N-ribohydrolase
VFTILRVFSCLHIPFYQGAHSPLVEPLAHGTWPGHGANGLGDASFLEGGAEHHHDEYQKRVHAAMGKKHAVQALIDLATEFPGEIDIIALGPLTNLALALRMGPPDLASRFRSLTLMGGSSHGRGNTTLAGEFNFVCDPEGAQVTLAGFAPHCPVIVLPWETTEAGALGWDQFDELTAGHEEHIFGDARTRHTLEASFLKKTHAKYELVCRRTPPKAVAAAALSAAAANSAAGSLLTADQAEALNEMPSIAELKASAAAASSADVQPAQASAPAEYICCDSFAVACYLRPELISASMRHHVHVVTQGTAEVRGMMAIDWYNKNKGPRRSPVTIVTKVDQKAYLQMMTQVFQPQQGKSGEASTASAK